MNYDVVDLHCDLLLYLQGYGKRTPFDEIARCSIPQLKAGNVKLQTMAVFTDPHLHTTDMGLEQLHLFQFLLNHHSHHFYLFDENQPNLSKEGIGIALAFEGASSFCFEAEPLRQGLHRLEKIIQEIAKPLYISLTWNMDNRFGGGSSTDIGLKEDGKHLLDFMNEYQIAIDFSHTSDRLGYDIFDYINLKGLQLPVMASHSNARTIANHPRNLPDELAKEVFRRGGVIGMNFYRPFIGSSPKELAKHLEHWIDLGGEDHLCFGADFFYDEDLPAQFRSVDENFFFEKYDNSACYPHLFSQLLEWGFSHSLLEKIASKNFFGFIGTKINRKVADSILAFF